MGKGSSGTKTTYTSSPEQQQLYSTLLPMISAMANQGVNNLGQSNFGMPNAPTAPSMSGVLSGVSPYNIPSYNIPNIKNMMPTKSWYDSMSPDVKAGVWAPYQEGANALQEQLGSIGGLGNQRGGVSGAGAAGLGNYYAKSAPNAAMSLWNMSQPAMQAGWQAELGQNQWGANQQLAQNQLGYQNQITEAQTNFQNLMNQQQQDYAMQKTAWGLPWALTGMTPSTFSQGITTQPSSPYGSMFGGMLTGGMMGGMMGQQTGMGSGYGAAGGGLLGGLSGVMGGK
jgi:hypothetical protein